MSGFLDRPHAARTQIERAISVVEIKGVRDWLESLRTLAKASGQSRDKINDIAEEKVRAEWKGGLLLREVERSAGERLDLTSYQADTRLTPYQQALREAGLATMTAHRWQVMSWCPEGERDSYFIKARETDKTIISSEDVYRLGKKAMPHETFEPDPIEGEYSVLVVDPPWPMEKIERDVRPNQAGFDYPTMNEFTLTQFGKETLVPIMAPDCHVFIWTTQKFLPMALRLLEACDLRYVLTMVWHKPGGFQPIGLPQYNCEFIVYARAGSPAFVDTKAFNCCFQAPRAEHSRKPDEFYDLIRRVTAGARIDIFSREKREGFEQYGNQVDKFEAA